MADPARRHGSSDAQARHLLALVGSDTDEVGGLRATLELVPVGIAHFDAAGRFLLVNSRLCSILGYSRNELLAATFDELTFPEDRKSCISANAQLAAGEVERYKREKRFIRRDGTAVWLRVTVSAVRNEADEVAFFVGVAEDISEQKAHEDARAAKAAVAERLLALERQARANAERANRMRDDVLAVVAHDLRNPLHTLQLSAMAMAEPDMTAEARSRQADLIRRLVESMDHLIGELLDIGRIETGSFPITCAPVALDELIDEAMTVFRPQADERGVRLTRDDDRDLGIISCDRTQIVRVFSNLIGNAVKFTPPDGRVSVRARRTADIVDISVCDTGPGIPPDDLEHVFDRFWQADRTARFGTGLGLVIAQGIVESHRGTIRVDSTVGRGSCFHFSLPARPSSHPAVP